MRKKRFTVKFGPLGLSLAAAAVTATAFAAVSLAASGSGSGSGAKDAQTFQAPAPPPGGGPGVFFRDNLSGADRQKMEEFRQCMEDNGAPAPPEPGRIDPSNPPKPPSADDQEKLRKAWEACKDKLPEDLQKAGPPQLHTCGPPPGAPAPNGESGNQQN
jgi:hypothetical protein